MDDKKSPADASSVFQALGFATAVLVVAGGLWVAVWTSVQSRVAGQEAYRISAEHIQITPPPNWIRSDVLAEAMKVGRLEGDVSLLDQDIVERVAQAFKLHPWVKEVVQVSKHYPAGLEVTLEYRQPVMMVEVPEWLYAVDAEGHLLPSVDFSPAEAGRYPRLVQFGTTAVPQLGEPFGDPRIRQAASVALALNKVWILADLAGIHVLEPSGGGTASGYDFELVSKSGQRVLWGKAAGMEATGEMSADQKAISLQQLIETAGPLTAPEATAPIDLRTSQSATAALRTASVQKTKASGAQ